MRLFGKLSFEKDARDNRIMFLQLYFVYHQYRQGDPQINEKKKIQFHVKISKFKREQY